MDGCLFIPIKNKFCELHLDMKVGVLICHFQRKPAFLFSIYKAVDEWGEGRWLPAPVIYVRMC